MPKKKPTVVESALGPFEKSTPPVELEEPIILTPVADYRIGAADLTTPPCPVCGTALPVSLICEVDGYQVQS